MDCPDETQDVVLGMLAHAITGHRYVRPPSSLEAAPRDAVDSRGIEQSEENGSMRNVVLPLVCSRLCMQSGPRKCQERSG